MDTGYGDIANKIHYEYRKQYRKARIRGVTYMIESLERDISPKPEYYDLSALLKI
jgi:hypothetical protein